MKLWFEVDIRERRRAAARWGKEGQQVGGFKASCARDFGGLQSDLRRKRLRPGSGMSSIKTWTPDGRFEEQLLTAWPLRSKSNQGLKAQFTKRRPVNRIADLASQLSHMKRGCGVQPL